MSSNGANFSPKVQEGVLKLMWCYEGIWKKSDKKNTQKKKPEGVSGLLKKHVYWPHKNKLLKADKN